MAKKKTAGQVPENKLAKQEPTDGLVIVQEKIKGMQAMLDQTKVTNDDELKAISDKIGAVKKLGKYISQEKDKFVAPAKEIIQQAKEKYDPYIKECQNAEGTLKSRALAYMQEQERVRLAKEAEIAKKAEEGRIKPETAIRRMENLPDAPRNVNTGESGLRMSKRKVAVIVDPAQVPDEYWIIDEVKVRKVALAGVNIPGVEVWEEAWLASLA